MTEHALSADGSILVEDAGGRRTITLRRERRANALSIPMMAALAEAIRQADGSPGVHAVVLVAAGARVFCAGADLADLQERGREQYDALRELINALDQRSTPLLCVLAGKALGAGCLLPVLSDIVIASEDAVLGFPEMRFGMYPALMHAVLAEKLSSTLSYAICAGGRSLAAREALALGLVTEVLDAPDIAQGIEKRIEFYVARSAAVRIGREMARETRTEHLARRVDRAERFIERNLASPGTAAMLADYLK